MTWARSTLGFAFDLYISAKVAATIPIHAARVELMAICETLGRALDPGETNFGEDEPDLGCSGCDFCDDFCDPA